jgi:hypothetical protein
VTGMFVAALVVTLLQFLRVRDRRLLPLIVLFTFLALAESQDDWRPRRWFQAGAVAAGLSLVAILSRPEGRPSPGAPPAK